MHVCMYVHNACGHAYVYVSTCAMCISMPCIHACMHVMRVRHEMHDMNARVNVLSYIYICMYVCNVCMSWMYVMHVCYICMYACMHACMYVSGV